jgi:hypothetical protein
MIDLIHAVYAKLSTADTEGTCKAAADSATRLVRALSLVAVLQYSVRSLPACL